MNTIGRLCVDCSIGSGTAIVGGLQALGNWRQEKPDELVIQDLEELEVLLSRPLAHHFMHSMQIERLVVHAKDIKDQAFQRLSQYLRANGVTKIKYMDIRGCTNITTFENCCFPDLVALYAPCSGLTNKGLLHLSHAAPKLEELTIYWCQTITSIEGCNFRNLRTLDATETGLSESAFEYLKRVSPHFESYILWW